MDQPVKTYSGQQAYHEMLVRAQALSPACTYVVCDLLLKIEIKPDVMQQRSRAINLSNQAESLLHLFSLHNPFESRMALFLKAAFGGFNVLIGFCDHLFAQQELVVDTQFLQWLQSDVVIVDDKSKLVTIKL